MLEEAQHSGWSIQELYIAENVSDRGESLLTDSSIINTLKFRVTDEVMADLTDTETPQGITAVLACQDLPLPDCSDFILILDAIRDPGNVGTILRTASAAGVKVVLVGPETADPFSPKVLRAGMGAQLKLPIRQFGWEELTTFIHEQSNLLTLLADTVGGTVFWDVDYRKAIALIVSNEAAGPSQAARKLADRIIQIPMPGDCESLNAAIAASIVMYEVVRQRQ